MAIEPNATTSLLHQVRDQALHLGLGAICGALLLFPEGQAAWWSVGLVTLFWAALREAEQWRTLRTPSLPDSCVDAAFIVAGSQAVWWGVWWLG